MRSFAGTKFVFAGLFLTLKGMYCRNRYISELHNSRTTLFLFKCWTLHWLTQLRSNFLELLKLKWLSENYFYFFWRKNVNQKPKLVKFRTFKSVKKISCHCVFTYFRTWFPFRWDIFPKSSTVLTPQSSWHQGVKLCRVLDNRESDSAEFLTPRSQTPQSSWHQGVKLRRVLDTRKMGR